MALDVLLWCLAAVVGLLGAFYLVVIIVALWQLWKLRGNK